MTNYPDIMSLRGFPPWRWAIHSNRESQFIIGTSACDNPTGATAGTLSFVGHVLLGATPLLVAVLAPRHAVTVPKTITAATKISVRFKRSPSRAAAKNSAHTGCENWSGATRTRPPRESAHSHVRL